MDTTNYRERTLVSESDRFLCRENPLRLQGWFVFGPRGSLTGLRRAFYTDFDEAQRLFDSISREQAKSTDSIFSQRKISYWTPGGIIVYQKVDDKPNDIYFSRVINEILDGMVPANVKCRQS